MKNEFNIGYHRIKNYLVVLLITGNDDIGRPGLIDPDKAEYRTDQANVLDILTFAGYSTGLNSINCNIYPGRRFIVGKDVLSGKIDPARSSVGIISHDDTNTNLITFRKSPLAAIMCEELPPAWFRGGPWHHYGPNGNLLHWGYYSVAGNREGPFVWFHPDGMFSKIIHYYQNVRTRKAVRFNNQGNTTVVATYHQGKLVDRVRKREDDEECTRTNVIKRARRE